MIGPRIEPSYFGITDGIWKYIWYPEGGHEQLFNLADDPKELVNLADNKDHKEKYRELHAELVARDQARGGQFTEREHLVTRPQYRDSERARRNTGWPGFHTEHYHVDVRH